MKQAVRDVLGSFVKSPSQEKRRTCINGKLISVKGADQMIREGGLWFSPLCKLFGGS